MGETCDKMYKEILNKLKSQEPFVVKTHITSLKEGRVEDLKREFLEVDALPIDDLGKLGTDGIAYLKEEESLYELFQPRERLLIFGGGHIASPLVEMGHRIGFSVVVVDDRPSFANHVRFPLADQVICDDFKKAIHDLKIGKQDYVVIVTRGHRHDSVCLEEVLGGEHPKYVGMIGSKRRVAIVKKEVIEKGHDEGLVNGIHSPIGLSIGAITPEEIGVSIIAEIIAHKRLVYKELIPINQIKENYEIFNAMANEDDPGALITIIESKGSVPRKEGARMIVYPDGRIIGSIGGGCSEAEAVGTAWEIIGTGRYCLQEVDLTADAAEEEGMVCGGKMLVLIEDHLR